MELLGLPISAFRCACFFSVSLLFHFSLLIKLALFRVNGHSLWSYCMLTRLSRFENVQLCAQLFKSCHSLKAFSSSLILSRLSLRFSLRFFVFVCAAERPAWATLPIWRSQRRPFPSDYLDWMWSEISSILDELPEIITDDSLSDAVLHAVRRLFPFQSLVPECWLIFCRLSVMLRAPFLGERWPKMLLSSWFSLKPFVNLKQVFGRLFDSPQVRSHLFFSFFLTSIEPLTWLASFRRLCFAWTLGTRYCIGMLSQFCYEMLLGAAAPTLTCTRLTRFDQRHKAKTSKQLLFLYFYVWPTL